MKRIVFLIFLFAAINNYAQALSKTHIIFESKDQIIMNNGKQYQKLVEKPYYEISDETIQKHKQVVHHVLKLNRILILRSDNEYTQVVEWLKENMRFYEYIEMADFNLEQNNISDSRELPIPDMIRHF